MSGLVDVLTKKGTVWKSVEVTGAATTVTVWTPATSTRIALTGLDISNFGNTTGTILVYFTSGTTGGVQRIGLYSLGTTTVLNLRFPGLETRIDNLLRAVTPVAAGFTVNAQGFELE